MDKLTVDKLPSAVKEIRIRIIDPAADPAADRLRASIGEFLAHARAFDVARAARIAADRRCGAVGI